MIAIIDYGVGNLFSLISSFKSVGEEVVVTDDKEVINRADKLVLPGVGAFGDAMAKLKATGLDRVVCDEAKNGKKLLGICLGMQLLFEKSFEYGEHDGLGLLKGSIIPMEGNLPKNLKIPHIGWNILKATKPCRLFENADKRYVYFVHSYYASGCDQSVALTTDYGKEITAAVAYKNIYGCQFHPEKSGETGLAILKAFCRGE